MAVTKLRGIHQMKKWMPRGYYIEIDHQSQQEPHEPPPQP